LGFEVFDIAGVTESLITESLSLSVTRGGAESLFVTALVVGPRFCGNLLPNAASADTAISVGAIYLSVIVIIIITVISVEAPRIITEGFASKPLSCPHFPRCI
jgi:hypothetical protein